MDFHLAQQLAVSLGLGLLVGLQRQWQHAEIAGIRTFALLTVFGTVAGVLAQTFGGWLLAAGLLAVAATLVTANLVRLRQAEADPGTTTEIAALLMYGVGALLALEQTAVALIVGGGVAVLLQWKRPLHAFVEHISETDIRAVFQLVLIALVILPVLPDRTFGPYGVLNPFETWLMVVLIVGLNLAGYVAYKLLSARAGAVLGGVLGGLVSSTATTVSFARRSRAQPDLVAVAALVIMIASTAVIPRVLIEIGAVAPAHLGPMAGPLVALGVVHLLLCGALFVRVGQPKTELPEHGNPAHLRTAVAFGLLYALVKLAVAAAKAHFDAAGLYAVALVAGLTDVDAITLSTAQLVDAGRVAPDLAWRAILLATLSNLVCKGLIVAIIGRRELAGRVAAVFGLSLAAGLAILLFYDRVLGAWGLR